MQCARGEQNRAPARCGIRTIEGSKDGKAQLAGGPSSTAGGGGPPHLSAWNFADRDHRDARVRKLVVSSATSEATSTLVDALARGEFRPGTRLTEESVAAQLGISRVPVREALSALVARALLERRGRAIHVPTLNYDDLEQVYLARGALEDILYERAAGRIDEQRIRTLTRLSQQIQKASETDSFDKINARNRAFHFAIMDAAELPLVTGILANLWDRTAFYRAFFALSPENREKTQVEHEEIIDACERGDAHALVTIHARHRKWLLDRSQPWLSNDGSGSLRNPEVKLVRRR